MSHVYTPVEIRQSPAYSNKFVQNHTITLYTPQLLADYKFVLPPDMGAYGKFLRVGNNDSTEWSELTIRLLTSAQRLALINVETGTIVYDSTVGQTFLWNGTAWVGLSTGFTDATFSITDDVTPTKVLNFQCSNIAPATTRTITMADRNIDLNTPIFSTVSLINGVNSVALASAIGTSAYTVTLPSSLPATGVLSALTTTSTGAASWGNTLSTLTTTQTVNAEGGIPSGTAGYIELQPTYSAITGGAVAVHEYMSIKSPATTGAVPPTITTAYLFNFDNIPGTHSVLDASTVKTTPTGVDAWIKVSVENPADTFTTYYVPAYLSKTA